MTIEEIKQKVASKEYNFLRENEHLGKNIILLGLGGSHAYGTNTETSDLDVRGIATNSKEEILSNIRFICINSQNYRNICTNYVHLFFWARHRRKHMTS